MTITCSAVASPTSPFNHPVYFTLLSFSLGPVHGFSLFSSGDHRKDFPETSSLQSSDATDSFPRDISDCDIPITVSVYHFVLMETKESVAVRREGGKAARSSKPTVQPYIVT